MRLIIAFFLWFYYISPAIELQASVMSHNVDFGTFSYGDEQVVGEWTDGRTLFRKTIIKSDGLPNGETNYNHDIANIRQVTKIEAGFYDDATGTSLILPVRSITGQWMSVWTATRTQIKFFSSFEHKHPLYITLYYTKTTEYN